MAKKFNNQHYNKELKHLARALRKNATRAEVRIWSELLRGGRMKGYTFLRQRPIAHFIANFLCKELKLIIEIDGFSHEEERRWFKDHHRQLELGDMGFTIVRFTDEEVMHDLRNVQSVLEACIDELEPIG